MPRRFIAALAALVALVAATMLHAGVRAEGGVPIPAETGSQWEIVAGYNTGTHSVADGDDPHAIDLVRLDDSSGGSAVLAPSSGSVSYSSNDCLAIRDAAGMEHLLCHILPNDGLERGSRVEIGQHVGIVWQAGYGNNGGLAHIHYAIHHSRGGGYLGASVPFTGSYAIEGVELIWADSFNLHGGTQFTSTNRRNWSAPATDNDDQPEETTATSENADDESKSATTSTARRPTSTVNGGWRSFAIDRETTLGALWSKAGRTLTSLFYWDRGRQEWRRYHPALPGRSALARINLLPGDAVMAAVKDGVAWLPRGSLAATAPRLQLFAGWNMVSWHGPDSAVRDAFAGLPSLISVFLWDNQQQRYLRWTPAGPDLINTLETVTSGATLWIQLGEAETWTQP